MVQHARAFRSVLDSVLPLLLPFSHDIPIHRPRRVHLAIMTSIVLLLIDIWSDKREQHGWMVGAMITFVLFYFRASIDQESLYLYSQKYYCGRRHQDGNKPHSPLALASG